MNKVILSSVCIQRLRYFPVYTKGIIYYCDDLYSSDLILTGLEKYNVVALKRIQAKRDGEFTDTGTFLLSFALPSPPEMFAFYCSKSTRTEPEIPQNPLSNIYSATSQPENGHIYDKKPFKMRCEKDKKYCWCLCGKSKTQPLCDGTHRSPYLKIKLRPVRFQVSEEKEYWLCNCKQTSNRPFCDGTHKRDDIQAAVK